MKQEKTGFFKRWKLNRELKRQRKIDYQKTISQLKVTTKINLNELVSDLRHFKPGFWNNLKGKIFSSSTCLCVIHYPGNVDIIRYYDMPKPFVVDINKKLYLFSPKAFRTINGLAKLEFYANIPFAILHNVSDKYVPPTLDADAFSSVQQSKFIQDACTVEEDKNLTLFQIIILIVCVLAFVIGIINLVYIINIAKHIT